MDLHQVKTRILASLTKVSNTVNFHANIKKPVRFTKVLLELAYRILLIIDEYVRFTAERFWFYSKIFGRWLKKSLIKTTQLIAVAAKKIWLLTTLGLKHTKHYMYLTLVKLTQLTKRIAIYLWGSSKRTASWIYKYALIILIALKNTSIKSWHLMLLGLKHLAHFTKTSLQLFWRLFTQFIKNIYKYSIIILKHTGTGLKHTWFFIIYAFKKIFEFIRIFSIIVYEGATGAIYYLFKATQYTTVSSCAGVGRLYRALIQLLKATAKYTKALLRFVDLAVETVLRIAVYIAKEALINTYKAIKLLILSPVILLNTITPTFIIERLKLYATLIRLDKPIGMLLLLWPAMLALWFAAEGWPDFYVLIIFVAGVFLMRSAGCAINDYADRDIDAHVSRTKARPLASGKITTKEALGVFVFLSIAAFIMVLFLNDLTIGLSFTGILLAVSYPFMKRFHYLPQVHLGAAFGWAVPMAYAAEANELTQITWLLFLATVLWATAYDTMYAMVDYDDDIKIGVKSTAILFGDLDKVIIGLIQVLLISDFILIGYNEELTGFYYTGVAIAAVLAVWQQFLIKDREPELCFKAFLNNNWLGLALFAGLFLEYQFGALT